ncbi:DUF917 family protein [Alkalimonas sp. NCh-2]|uniref:S-methyl thiohydantoin desulfurase domain-containing protein n=1 Tax=Alkalimonas sp. NCh-2 TaxID=3144846 RepID=UPI0031F702D8
MEVQTFELADFYAVAAGAAVLASGGGGGYQDAQAILNQLAATGWSGTVRVQSYDGMTNACVLAIMGSPNAAESLSLEAVTQAARNTLSVFNASTGARLGCLIPVEIGPINSLVPLIAAALLPGSLWVVDGDGAGRAVPELPQTTFGGSLTLPASPAALASDQAVAAEVESAVLNARTASQLETLAGGVVAAFGGYSGIALWPSISSNGFPLKGSYIEGTLSQAKALGQRLLSATKPLSTAEVAQAISQITGRVATALVSNFYITSVTQSTTSASLDCGLIRLDNSPVPSQSTQTHILYNLNENLIMYSSSSSAPDAIAPDSICYYSEGTGRGFSNASDDRARFFQCL